MRHDPKMKNIGKGTMGPNGKGRAKGERNSGVSKARGGTPDAGYNYGGRVNATSGGYGTMGPNGRGRAGRGRKGGY